MAAASLVATHLSDSIGLAVDALRVRGWVDSCGERPTTLRMSVDSKMRFLSPCLVSVPGNHEHGNHEHGPAGFAGSEDLTRQGATKKRHEWAEKFQEEARGGGLRSDSVGRLNEPGSKRVAFKREAKDGISVQLLTRAHLRRPFSELSVPEPETKMNVIPG